MRRRRRLPNVLHVAGTCRHVATVASAAQERAAVRSASQGLDAPSPVHRSRMPCQGGPSCAVGTSALGW